jgi:hypothetical protein
LIRWNWTPDYMFKEIKFFITWINLLLVNIKKKFN